MGFVIRFGVNNDDVLAHDLLIGYGERAVNRFDLYYPKKASFHWVVENASSDQENSVFCR